MEKVDESLTEDQQLKILTFQAMTEENDVSIALHFLTENHWDESSAANSFLQSKSQNITSDLWNYEPATQD